MDITKKNFKTMDPTDDRLNIFLRTQDGAERTFKIGKYTPIVRLLKKHCQTIDMYYKAVVFLINGERFDHKKTPAELKLKNGTVIDAFVHSDGGGPNRV